jgi:hypothetical protein
MASSYTASLLLEKTATGEQENTWGDTLGTNFDNIDTAIAGALSKSVAGSSNVNLTAAEALNKVITLTGVLTGSINVVVPTPEQVWFIDNQTSGAFTITVKTSGGTGIVVPQGEAVWLRSDGTNVVAMVIGASGYAGSGSVVTTQGDLIVADSGGAPARLAIGTASYVLTSDGNTAAWTAPAAVSPSIPAGAKMLFQSTAAPTGWTKDTTHNNKALRIVSGSVGTGGSLTFTSVFGSSISTGAHTLTSSDLPAHTHAAGSLVTASNGAHTHTSIATGGASTGLTASGSPLAQSGATSSDGAHTHAITGTTGSTGSGGGHSHTMPMDIQYVDFIIATKD